MSAEFGGTITNVTEEPVGSTLDEDVSAGADALKPAAKFVFTLSILVGMTVLLAKGTPDLLDRVWAAIKG